MHDAAVSLAVPDPLHRLVLPAAGIQLREVAIDRGLVTALRREDGEVDSRAREQHLWIVARRGLEQGEGSLLPGIERGPASGPWHIRELPEERAPHPVPHPRRGRSRLYRT